MSKYVRTESAVEPPSYFEVSEDGSELLGLQAAPWHALERTKTRRPIREGRLLVPVEPSKILCVGRNYRAHAEELGHAVPSEPLFFMKPPSSLLEHRGVCFLPPESQRVEYEAELAVVIGQRARRVSRESAAACIFGLTVACDVTARDLQRKDDQWTRAKGFDGFCPLGPAVVSAVDPSALGIELYVNDRLCQQGNTRDMVFDVASLISAASAFATLEPGDVLLTGTPHGVGPLTNGDRVRVSIERVGVLEFSVATEPEAQG